MENENKQINFFIDLSKILFKLDLRDWNGKLYQETFSDKFVKADSRFKNLEGLQSGP